MAIQEVLVSKIFNYTSEPTKKVEGQFWFNPSTNVLSRYNGTAWKAITVSSDDVAVLSDGNKISLTNYLNTQIAALAEGIDTKQDKLTYYSEEGFQSNTSAPYINLKAADSLTLKGSSSVNLSTDKTLSNTVIALEANDQSIKINSGDDEGTEGSIALDGNITGTGVVNNIGSYDMSSTKKLPTEHAIAEALVAKQDKLNFYSEKGKDYLSEYTEAKLSNVANITLDATNINGGSNIKLISTSAAAIPGYLTLQAKCTLLDTSAKIYFDSGDTSTSPSITIDGNLKGSSISTSIPTNGAAVDTKVVSEKAVASHIKTINESKQDKLRLYSEDAAEAIAEFNTIYTNINASEGITLNGSTNISFGNLSISSGSIIIDGVDYINSTTKKIDSKQSKEDNTLETSTKTIVGAINEINTNINNLDQSSAKTSDLVTKSNISTFHIPSTGGALKISTSPIGSTPIRSMCLTMHFDEDFSVEEWQSSAQINIIGDLGYANGLYNGICLRMTADGRLYLLGGRTVSGNVNLTLRNYFPTFFGGTSNKVIPAGTYALVMTVSMNEESTFSQIFVNSALKDSNTMTTINTTNFNAGTGFDVCSQGNFHGTNFTNGCFSGQISRIMAFNFDMSASDTPYSISDYQTNKPVPPELCNPNATNKALVYFDDYTFNNKVFDISGNGNTATVTGTVIGDRDQSVKQMYDAFAYQYKQENPTA